MAALVSALRLLSEPTANNPPSRGLIVLRCFQGRRMLAKTVHPRLVGGFGDPV